MSPEHIAALIAFAAGYFSHWDTTRCVARGRAGRRFYYIADALAFAGLALLLTFSAECGCWVE